MAEPSDGRRRRSARVVRHRRHPHRARRRPAATRAQRAASACAPRRSSGGWRATSACPWRTVAGSGPHGRVRIADVEARGGRAAQTRLLGDADPAAGAAVANRGDDPAARAAQVDRRPHAGGLAERAAGHDAWICSTSTELVRARELLRRQRQAEGARLTYLPLFVKAAIQALKAVPEANAVVDERQAADRAQERLSHRGGHGGTGRAGGAGDQTCRSAESARAGGARSSGWSARRASDGARLASLSGSTFTITSFGGLPGSPLFATPIVNYPEVAILGLGRIDLQPRVVDGAGRARQCLGVSFTFDHRVLDGEGAGRFMAAFEALRRATAGADVAPAVGSPPRRRALRDETGAGDRALVLLRQRRR